MPKVSVLSIARDNDDLNTLRNALKNQSYQNFEFIGEVGGTIPEAWNRAIARSKGEILVFTETDATPVNEQWLEELVTSVSDNKTIVKGLEITGSPLDMSNLAAHRSAFEDIRFDESFRWAEDTELFCRLQEKGFRIRQVNTAPVIHLQKLKSKRMIRRAFLYGIYQARIKYRYKDENSVEVAGVMEASKLLIRSILNLLGLGVGYLLYWHERK